MERIYRVTLGSSLAQALVVGLLFSFMSLSRFLLAAVLTLVSVCIGFTYVRRLRNRNMMPSWGTAMGVGAVLGSLSAIGFYLIWSAVPFVFGPLYLLICLIGAVVGVPLGLVNYVLWKQIGFIRFVHEPDDVKYQCIMDEAAEMAAGQEGVWPPPPQRPDGNLPHR